MKTKKLVLLIAFVIALVITASSALATTGDDLQIVSVEVNNIEVTESGDSLNLKPLQEFVVKVTVLNNDTEPIAGITGDLTTFVDQEFTSNTLNLAAGETGELTFEGVVSIDEVEDSYFTELGIVGEDFSGEIHDDAFSFEMGSVGH